MLRGDTSGLSYFGTALMVSGSAREGYTEPLPVSTAATIRRGMDRIANSRHEERQERLIRLDPERLRGSMTVRNATAWT